MYSYITSSEPCKAAARGDKPSSTLYHSPSELYAVRKIARRAHVSTTHAALIAQLLGISKEASRD